MAKWYTLHKGAFFISDLIFLSIPWAPYSTSTDCNRNRKKSFSWLYPKTWQGGEVTQRQTTQIPQTGNQNYSSNAATGVHQQEKGQDLLATKVTWINHCSGQTVNAPILNTPMAESSPGTFTFCEAADWFQARAGFCADIANSLQRPEAEQLVLPSTFFTTVQPQGLSSCLVMDGLVPSTGFLEDSRSHAVFTWAAANLEKGWYRTGGCGLVTCPLPPCASRHKGRSAQTSLSNFFMPLKQGVLQAGESAPWLLGKTTNE